MDDLLRAPSATFTRRTTPIAGDRVISELGRDGGADRAPLRRALAPWADAVPPVAPQEPAQLTAQRIILRARILRPTFSRHSHACPPTRPDFSARTSGCSIQCLVAPKGLGIFGGSASNPTTASTARWSSAN